MIGKLLIVDSNKRPSIKDVLKMEIVKKKCLELEHTTEYFDAVDNFGPEADTTDDPLLKTIRVPNNLINLSSRLPKSNYSKLRGTLDPRSKTRFQTGDSEKRLGIQTLTNVKNRAESMLPVKTDLSETSLKQNLPQI
jgi:hypothetical protein